VSIATDIRTIVTSQDVSTYALAAGYAMKKSGIRVEFPQWAAVGTPKKDDEGRIVHAQGKYPDGSTLTYKWTPSHGRKVVAGEGKL
jgi:hypothetical protein